MEGDERDDNGHHTVSLISIHALRMEGDWRGRRPLPASQNFYPRPPHGGRPVDATYWGPPVNYFYPRPPHGGRRKPIIPIDNAQLISIHALRMEGDDLYPVERAAPAYFYPRPPHGGRRAVDFLGFRFFREFLSTPSAWRATRPLRLHPPHTHISIHALRMEGDRASGLLAVRATAFLSTPSAWRATPKSHEKQDNRSNFYPRPPHGGRPVLFVELLVILHISIHALRMEGDVARSPPFASVTEFLSTPSAWRATGGRNVLGAARKLFLSTPSAWRATQAHHPHRQCTAHFYPRPPHGGRRFIPGGASSSGIFLSTPSAWRATRGGFSWIPILPGISIHALRMEGDAAAAAASASYSHFYPRPPHGGRQGVRLAGRSGYCISIHALRMEGDPSLKKSFARRRRFLSTPSAWRATGLHQRHHPEHRISIHALRMEGDRTASRPTSPHGPFLSTPSAWRATHKTDHWRDVFQISIHALRMEGDPRWRYQASRLSNFYPRPPHGGRPCDMSVGEQAIKFLSTPSAWRATVHCLVYLLGQGISIHALRMEGDRRRKSLTLAVKFLSTPSAWRATRLAVDGLLILAISIHALRMEGDTSPSWTTAFLH